MHSFKSLFLANVIVMASAWTSTIAADTKDAVLSKVRVDNQQLSIQATNTSLDILLAEIARQSHINIFIQGQLNRTVTISLQRTPLASGIKKLINGHNHALTYGFNDRDDIVIQKLHIYSASGLGETRLLTFAGTNPPAEAAITDVDNGILIHAQTPQERDPHVSMQAIDPLMKINHAQALHLPEGFHDDRVSYNEHLMETPPFSD